MRGVYNPIAVALFVSQPAPYLCVMAAVRELGLGP